jgi:hypothetical protein
MSTPLRRVAHDLNNVFAAILGCADLLTLRLRQEGAAIEDAKEIQRAAERGAALTRRLAKMARRAGSRPRKARRPRRGRRKV